MDNNYYNRPGAPDPQRPRKRVSRKTIRNRQLCGLAIIALVVLIIVIIFANACTKKPDKSKSDSTATTASTANTTEATNTINEDEYLATATNTTEATEPTNDPNSGFKLSRNTAYFTVGSSDYAAIISEYPSGSTEADEVWSSSDPSIASVNNLGLVTALAPGECYITVSTSKDLTKEAMIKVVVAAAN